MQITRLRLIGFKSFVEPTDLAIEPGLTGVVGPNGCGKSNLLEALRWVMGETSFKTMRASAMEDVIFSGTQSRPPRNSAEVTMFLDNSSRSAPAGFNDSDILEVTRRIEREAGSAYKINGRDVRARDTQLLFADASTGARSPALVQQGQIGEIVNAKPQARRRILEEAAGITGLHSRRHEAELRLRAAEGNLERLQDIMGQLHSRLSSLKRQTRQAIRYKELSTLIQHAEAIQFHLAWSAAGAAVTAEEAALHDTLRDVGAFTQEESAALREQADAAEALQPLRQAEVERAAILNRFSNERDSLDREEARAKERQGELTDLAGQLDADLEREKGLISEARELLARLAEEQRTLNASTAATSDAVGQAREVFDTSRRELDEAEATYDAVAAGAAELKARREQLQTAEADFARQYARLEEQKNSLERQFAEIGGLVADAEKHGALSTEIGTAAQKIINLEGQIGTAERHAEEAGTLCEQLRERSHGAKIKAQNLQTEVQTLTKLLIPTEAGEWHAVIDRIRVAPGYETSLAAALGDDLDAPTDERAAVHWKILPNTDDVAFQEGVVPLAEFVEAPPELARRLARIGVVDREAGSRIQLTLKPGERLVSKEGDLWRWDGFSASADSDTSAAKRLAERNRLERLRNDMQEAATAAATAIEDLAGAEERARKAKEVEKELRLEWRELQNTLERLRGDLAGAERAQQEHKTKLSMLEESRRRLDDSFADHAERRAAVEAAVAALPPADQMEGKLAVAQSEVSAKRKAHMETQAAVDRLERDARMVEERLASISEETGRWNDRALSAERQANALAERIRKNRSDLDVLAGIPARIAERRGKLLTEISVAEKQRQKAADALAEAENRLNSCNQRLKDIQARLSVSRENRARIEARLEATRERRADQARQIRDSLGCAPENCLKMAGLESGDELPALQEIEARLQKLKSDRERLGGVNLRAEEETTELSTQYEDMEREKKDLEEAIARLRQGISSLNREGRKRLLEAFSTVDNHFKHLFTVLFGGGEAKLQLVESDDPLEAGLEIIARPPGKKPQVLTLLSGGEKALTALALIFAVFLTNPSPICVLDEVDAPLDDSNVDRFCTLLEDMAENTATRFLIITHHPMTMARVNRLFGVTMSERGVSQLVSVDLATAERFREAS